MFQQIRKTWFIFSLAISINSTAQTDTTVDKIIKERFRILSNCVSDSQSMPVSPCAKGLNFFVELTGITSEANGSYSGQISPTENDLRKWKIWYILNQQYLGWDEKSKSIILKKSIKLVD